MSNVLNYSTSEYYWARRIMRLSCAVCFHLGLKRQAKCEERHHIQDQNGIPISHFATIPLCRKHHITKRGVHCQWPQKRGITETILLAETIERVCNLITYDIKESLK